MIKNLHFARFFFIILLITCFLSGNTLRAQSNHTVIFTGNSTDFNTAEKFSAAAGNTDYYISFDATYMYFGAFSTSGSIAASNNFAIYIDTDPRNTLASGNGTTSGRAYNGVTPSLPFNADYSSYTEQGYTDPLNKYNGSWATTGVTPFVWSGANYREVRIALSDLGNPASVYVSVFMGYAGGIYSSAPGLNVAASATPALTGFFGSFPVYKSGITPVTFRTQNITAANGGGTAISNLAVSSNTSANGDYGDITITGAFTWTLNGISSYTGTLTVGSGTSNASKVDLNANSLNVGGRGIGGTAGVLSLNGSSGTVLQSTGTSTLNFLGAGSINGANTTKLMPSGLTMKIGGAVDFFASGTIRVVFGTGSLLQINANGSVLTNPPTYNTGSTIIYNTGAGYTAGTEWTPNVTSGAGYPDKVTIQGNTSLNFGSSNQYRQASGDITISLGSSLTLSSVAGGDIKFQGNFINSGSFSTNGRALWWVGTGTKTYTKTGGGTDNIDIFIHNSTSTLNLAGPTNATNWTLLSTGTTTASCLQMQNSGSLYLDANTLTIPASGTIYITGASSQIQGAGAATPGVLSFAGVGNITPVTSGTSTLTTTAATRVQTGSQLIIGGTAATPALSVTGVFQLNQGGYVDNTGGTGIPVKYNSGSTLVYNHTTGTYGVQTTEWPSTNSPSNVTINANGGTGITFATNNITARTLSGTLTLNHDINLSGSGTPNLTTLNTIANATATVKGTGNFTHSASGSFTTANTAGINGTITTSGLVTLPATTSFTFNGTASQVTGTSLPPTIAALTISNTAGGTNGVTISNNALTISGVTTLTAGALILPTATGNLVTFTGNISTPTGGGTITGSSTSNISTAATIAGTANALTFTSGGASLKNWTHTTTTNFGSSSGGVNSVVSIYGTFSTTATSPFIYVGPSGGFIFTSGSSFIDNGTSIGTSFMQTTSTGGSFTLQSGASFTTANQNGLNATGSSGAVQTTNRTFNGGANYTFANTSAAQAIGTALDGAGGTGKTGAITGNVIFNNNNSTGVTLNAGTTLTVDSPGAITVGTGSTAGILTIPATSFINGTGNFSLLGNGATSGSSLTVANASGINGAISSGTISLTNGANNNTNFTFNASVQQVTGLLLPATVNNFTSINTFSSLTSNPITDPGLTLSSSCTVNGTIALNGGVSPLGQFGIGANNTLTVNGALTLGNANKLIGTSTSNLIVAGTGAFPGLGLCANGGTTLNNFTINRTGVTVFGGANITVVGTFSLTNGLLNQSAGLNLNGPIAFGASGQLRHTGGGLSIAGSGAITGTLTTSTSPLTLTSLTMNRAGQTLTLGTDVTISGGTTPLTLSGGVVDLGATNSLTLISTNSITVTPTNGGMIKATGTGFFVKTLTTGASTFTFPIGDGTNYSPIALAFTANTTAGTVGSRVTATYHPQYNNSGPQTHYLNRYWSFTTTGLTNYTYNSSYTYVPGDITGGDESFKLNRWNGSAWTEYSGSTAASNVLTAPTGLTQATGTLNANDFTGRLELSATNYAWNGSASNDWATPTNWTPNGIPGALDNVTIGVPGSNTNCSINSGSKSVASLTLNGTGILNMASGSTLSISGAFTYDGSSGATATFNTSSTVNMTSSSAQTVPALNYGNLNLTGGDRTLASSGTTGIAGTYTPGAGAITVSGSTMNFNGTSAQTIPLATYNNITVSTTGGNATAGGAITVNAILNIASGSTFDMSTYALSGAALTTSGTGIIKTQNTTTTPFPTGRTWSMEVHYTGASGQTIIEGTYGNLLLSGAGTKTIAASTSVTVNGSLTNNSTLSMTSGTSSISTWLTMKGDVTNNPGAVITSTATYLRFMFSSSNAQTFTNNGTVTSPMTSFDVSNTNASGLTLAGSNSIIVARANLFTGTVNNSAKLTIGTGTTATIQRGVASATNPAGAFDVNPVFNVSSTGLTLLYSPGSVAYSTGPEVPASLSVGSVILFTTSDVTLSSDLTITSGLTFSSGTPVFRIGAHTLTLGGTITYTVGGSLYGGLTSNLVMNAATTLNAVNNGLNNLTINAATTLGGAVTVNGTLALKSGTFTNAANLTMANGATIARTGGSLSATPTFGSSVNVIYGDGTYSTALVTSFELPALATVLNNLTVNISGGVTLSIARTVNGTLTLTNGVFSNGAYLTMATGTTITRSGGSLAAVPTFAGTVNLVYTGASSISTGYEIPTSTVLTNLTTNTGGVVQSGIPGTVSTLYSQGFEGAPADWTTEILTNTGTNGTPAITYVTSATSASPTVTPTEGTQCIQFNSFNCDAGDQIRLKKNSSPISTTGKTNVTVVFDWAVDAGYSASNDYVTIQWSTNGTDWTSSTSYYRYNAIASFGTNSCVLPVGSENQASLYIALLFNSAFGNNCHLDNLKVKATGSASPSTCTVTGTFDLSSGTYSIGANTLTLIGGITPTNSIIGGTTSNLSIGGSGANLTLPSITNGLNNFTVNRANGVTLGGNLAVNGVLSLTNGVLTSGSNTVTALGTVTDASISSYVDGKLARVFSTAVSKDFPIGKGGNYRPVTFNYTTLSGTSTVTAEQIESTIPGTTPAHSTLSASRYWSITESGSTSRSFNVTLDGTGYTPSHSVVMISGDGTTNTLNNVTTPNYTNSTSFSAFNPNSINYFGLGESTNKISIADGSWYTNGTWSPSGVPVAGEDITINHAVTIDAAPTAECTDLTINSGKSLTVSSGNSLTVGGTLINNATATGLVINSGGSLIQNSAVPAIVKRSVSAWINNTHGWHFLSSPVADQTIASGFTTSPAANYDFYAWWEPTNEWVNYKNTTTAPVWSTANVLGVTSGAGNFIPGKGYLVSYAATDTKQFSGTLNKDDIGVNDLAISTGTNNGWHLLGNPFTSALTWGTGWSLTHINATAKIWEESSASYVDISTGGKIPALNGFMVQVDATFGGNNSLTIPTSARTHDATAWYKSTDYPHIVLVARDPAGQTAQQTVIRFDEGATTGFDPAFDSHFLSGYAPLFYSVAGSEHLSTNSLPEVGGTVQIPVSFVKNDGSNFTIEAKKISNLFGPVILNDLKTNSSQDLTLNPVYSFTSTSGDDPNRFLVTFHSVGINETQTGKVFTIYTSGNTLYVTDVTGKNQGVVYVYNLMGQRLLQQNVGGNLTKITLNTPTGYYLLKIVTNDHAYTTKVFINN
ncbi:MAG: T9SS type A sorting domain-containing protein [Bacteroidales bacterium]